jgi:pimeloyl-ACP methyl ester carboxylesterase
MGADITRVLSEHGRTSVIEIAVPDGELDELRRRLSETRWPESIDASTWEAGVPLEWLQSVCEAWQAFPWMQVEQELNRFEHRRIEIDGVTVHAAYRRGVGPAPTPLVLTHGWPSTFAEFRAVVGPLSDPESFGGDPLDAFDVIVPSLPGYGLTPLRRAGLGPRQIADLWSRLPAAFGYEQAGYSGGDWGSLVSGLVAWRHPQSVSGLHLTTAPVAAPRSSSDRPNPRRAAWLRRESGYSAIQSSKPNTLAFGLNDSPAGLAAWLGEKWMAWSDASDVGALQVPLDPLLTALSLYWFTGTAGSAARLYYEHDKEPFRLREGERIAVPTALSVYPAESYPARLRIESAFDLRQWTEHDRGGHFPAAEQPESFVDDLRRFFRSLRS